MKNKKHHILSILLIIFMILMAVSTSPPPAPKEIRNRISYETRGEYFLIKIRTRINPNNYGVFGSHYRNSEFQLSFNDPAYNDQKEMQLFMMHGTGEYVIMLFLINEGEGWSFSEQIIMNEEDFGTFTEDGYFIIRIRNALLRYENPRLAYICLSGKNGEYIHEAYLE